MSNKNISPVVYIILTFIFYVCIIVLLPNVKHSGDHEYWSTWSIYSSTHGLGNVYFSDTDYPPLFQYVLYAFGKIMGSEEAILKNIHLLKIFYLLFDLATCFILLNLLKVKFQDSKKRLFLILFYLLNFGALYNSVLWGQVDSILTCFLFASIYLITKNNVLGALIFYLLAINFKFQAIIFLPIISLLIIPKAIHKISIQNLAKWIIVPTLVQVIILMPFILNSTVGLMIENSITSSVDRYPYVSLNAFNMWYWFIPGNLAITTDKTLFLSLSYKNWGFLLFFSASFFALLPLLISSLKLLFQKQQIQLKQILIVSALIPLIFFFFNTQMHERYTHPALIFAAAYAIIYKKKFVYILLSFAYFLNMFIVSADLQNRLFSIRSIDFIAAAFFICILLLFKDLYKNFNIKNVLEQKPFTPRN